MSDHLIKMDLIELNRFVARSNTKNPEFNNKFFTLLVQLFLSILKEVVTLCDARGLDLSSIKVLNKTGNYEQLLQLYETMLKVDFKRALVRGSGDEPDQLFSGHLS